jgi:hypothetical protein
MRDTLETLLRENFQEGLFFQNFIHSGLNPYLTLHVAHALLYAGDRDRFWALLTAVVNRATSTHTFPEAIHPMTGGGVMGDGHHGWAAAEIVLAVRDAFVHETWQMNEAFHRLRFLAGVPSAWFREGTTFSISRCPVPEGFVSLFSAMDSGGLELRIAYDASGIFPAGSWDIVLPGRIEHPAGSAQPESLRGLYHTPHATIVNIKPGNAEFHFTFAHEPGGEIDGDVP